jgi:uncharacterized membrane protein
MSKVVSVETKQAYPGAGSIATEPPNRRARAARLASLDIIRGAVMVLMAVDHVRVFAGVPPGGPTPGVFFTRWITHFCAPAFVFLAGTGAFLHGQKLSRREELARFLWTRGLWLIFIELTVSRLSWTFNLDFLNYTEGNILWATGWCMILLAGLVYLPVKAIATIGLVIIAGHNLADPYYPQILKALQTAPTAWFWQVLYVGGPFRVGGSGPRLVILYTIVPWIGVIAAGYAFGPIMQMEPDRRRRLCLRIGLGAIAAFLVLRTFNLYGDPRPWGTATSKLPAVLSFLNTVKYPASLLFLLMTLGPAIALIPALEHARGRVAEWLSTFGRVPFFYYVLHLPLIHTLAVLVSLVRTPAATGWLFANHPLDVPPPPPGYIWSLPLLYAVWAVAVTILYFACRWYAGAKARNASPWLSYL